MIKNLNHKKLSKKLSYILRHHPEKFGLIIDEYGFTDINHLLNTINSEINLYKVTIEDINEMLNKSTKKRFEIIGDKIRAMYGHSKTQNIIYEKAVPPKILYHGTAKRFVTSIKEVGLLSMSRKYVHLSVNKQLAKEVGIRHDHRTPIILTVNAEEAYQNGVQFYKASDKIWLTTQVPYTYIDITNS